MVFRNVTQDARDVHRCQVNVRLRRGLFVLLPLGWVQSPTLGMFLLYLCLSVSEVLQRDTGNTDWLDVHMHGNLSKTLMDLFRRDSTRYIDRWVNVCVWVRVCDTVLKARSLWGGHGGREHRKEEDWTNNQDTSQCLCVLFSLLMDRSPTDSILRTTTPNKTTKRWRRGGSTDKVRGQGVGEGENKVLSL